MGIEIEWTRGLADKCIAGIFVLWTSPHSSYASSKFQRLLFIYTIKYCAVQCAVADCFVMYRELVMYQ